MRKHWNKLLRNVMMSSDYGAAGARIDTNPKLGGRIAKSNQSTKRHTVEINEDHLQKQWNRQQGRCHWLGVKMDLDDLYESHSPFAPSVDRIDNGKGYSEDNIVICLRMMNKGRGKYDAESFKERLERILKETRERYEEG